MNLPVRKSIRPRENAPIWATMSVSGIIALIVALQDHDLSIWLIAVIVVAAMILGFIGGLIAQNGTVPGYEILDGHDHDDPA